MVAAAEPLQAEAIGVRGLGAALTGLGLFMIYAPLVYLLLASLNGGLQPGLVPPSEFSLHWYEALSGDTRMLGSLMESIVVGLATAAVATLAGLAAALAYMEMTRIRGAWFLFVLFTMFVPGVIQGLGLSVVFKAIAVKPSWITVTAGHILWATPFAFTVILASLANVRRSYLLAASDLGASWMRSFLDVTLPLILTGMVSSFVFAFLLSLNEYARAYFLVGRRNTLPLYMFGAMNSGASPTIYALSGAIVLVSFLAAAILLAVTSTRR